MFKTLDTETLKKRYSILLDTDDLITIFTANRIRKIVNKTYCDFFQKEESELIGTCFIDDFPEEKKQFYLNFTKSMTPDNPSITTIQKAGNTDKQKWVHWKETGIFDDAGNLIEIVSQGRVIDETIETKKEKKALLNMLMAHRKAIESNIICSITDNKGIITYANDKFCEISKYTRRELLGSTHNIINSGYHTKAFFGNMWQTITSGRMWQGEIKNKAKDGTLYWVNATILPMKGENNNINGYLSLRILINDQKELEEERHKHTKTIEDMLFMVSHELRRPISSVEGLLNILKSGIPAKEEYDKMIAYFIDAIQELDTYSRKLNLELQKNIDHKTSNNIQ